MLYKTFSYSGVFLTLLIFTCYFLCLCTAEDIEGIVHGFQLHSVHCVWRQGVDGGHHRVAAELGKDGSFGGVLWSGCDLVEAGTTVALPLHRYTL